MATTLTHGEAFSAKFTTSNPSPLTQDWEGMVELFTAGSQVAAAAWQLELSGNALLLFIPIDAVNNLSVGQYTLITTIRNDVLGELFSLSEPVTVVEVRAIGGDMTTITMTIAKIDGTPTGRETKTITNTTNGTVVTLGWEGVTVTASHPVADEVTGIIIGTESISTKTDANGYAQLAVIKGQTVTISCPSFGKTVTVNTTGLDTVDLSSSF